MDPYSHPSPHHPTAPVGDAPVETWKEQRASPFKGAKHPTRPRPRQRGQSDGHRTEANPLQSVPERSQSQRVPARSEKSVAPDVDPPEPP
eukprot:7350232-Pyramimonas_sp.AAC.1